MLRLCTLLVALSFASVALAGSRCRGNGRMLRQFNGRKEDTKMPCKYNAVSRQQCGDYYITLTPGNIYLHPKYRVDSLWLAIEHVSNGKRWEGRTDNKLAVKYSNGWKSDLFVKKSGDFSTKTILKFGKSAKKTWVKATNGDFRVMFMPWDPENAKFPMSQWIFDCYKTPFEGNSFSEQVCGGKEARESVSRMDVLGLKGREQVVVYDVFTNSGIQQTNPKCENATRLMTKVCTEEQRRDAVLTCSEILTSYKHAKCVSKYTCDPMDAFVDCVDWVCSDYKDDFACERVGRGIDMCRRFNQGNLTEKVEEENCFKDFLNIE